ncbi:MAG: integral membrane sensor signal transduction histidine kinase [Nitrospirae bacterium]|nr:MAG: integral membrane sensor signal transduction histidine kinase [Nitrospirota bacterium]
MRPLYLLILLLLPVEGHAYVPHDYPAIYTHQIGNIYYALACAVFLWTIIHNNLRKEPGWRYIFIALICFLAWVLIVFFGRLIEAFVAESVVAMPNESTVGWDYFFRTLQIDGAGYLFFLSRFDFIVLNIAMFFFYRGLREHLNFTEEREKNLVLPAVVLPLLPILLTDIFGNILFLVLAYLCLVTSFQLFRRERENILWSYMVWLSSAFLFFACSRSFGHVWRHFLIPMEHGYVWQSLEAISGSLNTAVRFFVATLTLFFVWIYQIYLKMSDDKKKIEEVSADIMNLNQEMGELGAERTFALLGLRIADNIRNPVSIIGCVSHRMLKREDIPVNQRENLEDVLDACRKLEKIVADFESIIKNRPRMFRYEDVNEVVHSIVEAMRPEAEQRGITLIADLSHEPAKINLQRSLFRVGLFYLMRNAINATSAGGSITVQTFVSGELVTVRISDTGCGISQEMLQRLFDPLYSQSGGERLRMAMPLVRQIVTEHLGEIIVNSEPGKGTTFDIIFPVKWCMVSNQVGKEVETI